MLEAGREVHCEDCIDRNRMTLVRLARKYVAADHWVKDANDCLPGDYSLEAVHAIGRVVDIDRSPFDIRGPFVREDRGRDAAINDLLDIKLHLTQRQFTYEHIRSLAEIARKGEQSFNNFLNQSRAFVLEQAQKAKPFLDRMVNRDRSEVQRKREPFQLVYLLDQGPFILAKTALEKCDGPWFRICPLGEKYQRFHVPLPRRV